MGCCKRKYEALLTLTERKTRKEIIVKIDAKASEAVTKAMTKIQKHYGSLFSSVFKTITSDNGSEFAELSLSLKREKIEDYFTHPYTSSEQSRMSIIIG